MTIGDPAQLSRRAWLAIASASAGQLLASAKLDTAPEYWTLTQAAAALRRRAISSEELTRLCLARAKKLDPALNSFITVTEGTALAEARACDQRIHRREPLLGPLDGIPIAIKDNIDTAGIRTTAGSRVFAHRVPALDAEVAARLKAAGTVCLGKLNLDEFAFAGTGTTSFFGPVHNPWNLAHITGGSSAGPQPRWRTRSATARWAATTAVRFAFPPLTAE